MDFGLSRPQVLLRDSISSQLKQSCPMEHVRAVMESATGEDRGLRTSLGEQGTLGLLIPEEHGGSALGMLEASVAAQEIGRAAAPISYHTAAVMAPLLLRAGSSEAQASWLPRIAEGKTLATVVFDAPVVDGKLDGSVLYVPDAPFADVFLLDCGGSVHLLEANHSGLSVDPLATVDDTRRLGEVRFDGVSLADATDLRVDSPAIERARRAGQIALAADALAAAQEGLRISVEYAKQREQFGRVIASYQALKHICAEVVAEVDPVQSLLWYTAFAWDQQQEDETYLVPLLKAHATEVASHSATMTTQVFGGIGFTHECDMHIFYKRAGYDRQILGNPMALRQLAGELQYG